MKPQVFFLALVTAFLWGTAPIFEKSGLSKASPMVGLAIRSIVITIGILTVIIINGAGKELLSVDRSTFIKMALGGLISGFIGQFLYFYILKTTQASSTVPLIAGVYPLIAATLAVVVLREPVTGTKVAGALFVVVGIVLLKMS